MERLTGHLWNWNMLFCILQFETKSIGHGKFHQAPMEHVVLNPTFLKPNPQVVEKSIRHL